MHRSLILAALHWRTAGTRHARMFAALLRAGRACCGENLHTALSSPAALLLPLCSGTVVVYVLTVGASHRADHCCGISRGGT